MGLHWVDTASPELPPRNQPFTTTFTLSAYAAIVITLPVSDAPYLGFQLGSLWYISLDYINHQTSLNGTQAQADPDGKIRIVGVRLTPEETAKLAAGNGIHASLLVVYSSDWCPDCRRAKRVLEEAEGLGRRLGLGSRCRSRCRYRCGTAAQGQEAQQSEAQYGSLHDRQSPRVSLKLIPVDDSKPTSTPLSENESPPVQSM